MGDLLWLQTEVIMRRLRLVNELSPISYKLQNLSTLSMNYVQWIMSRTSVGYANLPRFSPMFGLETCSALTELRRLGSLFWMFSIPDVLLELIESFIPTTVAFRRLSTDLDRTGSHSELHIWRWGGWEPGPGDWCWILAAWTISVVRLTNSVSEFKDSIAFKRLCNANTVCWSFIYSKNTINYTQLNIANTQ